MISLLAESCSRKMPAETPALLCVPEQHRVRFLVLLEDR
jgi:hypothetical protein